MVIDEAVSVGLVNDVPKYVVWKSRNYTVDKIGLHHAVRKGRTLYHIFSVTAGTVFLRLRLDTDSLLWRLEEISDQND